MADYLSTGRTNYFLPRCVDTLRNLLEDSGIELVQDRDGTVALLDGEGTDWTLYSEDFEDGIYLPDIIAEHLVPGQVVVFRSVGSEKMRYLGGNSVAVNADGDQVVVNLDDIYAAAAKAFGVPEASISRSEY